MNIIEQGLALENALRNSERELGEKLNRYVDATWKFADWLAANTTVGKRKDAKLEVNLGSHAIPLSAYAEASSYSRQRLYQLRDAAILAPPNVRTDKTSVALVNKLYKQKPDFDWVREQIPGQSEVAKSPKKNPSEQTYFDAISRIAAAKGYLKKADEIIEAQTYPLTEEGDLESVGELLSAIEDYHYKITQRLGME